MGAVGLGLVVGILAALALRRRLGTMLFQTAPTDPAIILGVGALLLSVAAVASLIPTLRAARRNPATALRVD
jgi:ABC-type antimicrobial peptide transport system permease subunit